MRKEKNAGGNKVYHSFAEKNGKIPLTGKHSTQAI